MADRSQYVRHLEDDVISRTRRTYVSDRGTGKFHIVHEQNVEPLFAANQLMRKESHGTKHRDLNLYARVGPVKQLELMQRGIWGDPDAIKKWLNSDDALPYRTRSGRV